MVKEHFGIGRKAPTVGLAAWPHVLLAGAKGETVFARKMRAYIQGMASIAEAEQESREQAGLGIQENAQAQFIGGLDGAKLLTNSVGRLQTNKLDRAISRSL
jgi:hypothetical protein